MILSEIARQTENQWQALPAHFRLNGSLKHCDRSPFQCDFLLSVRLYYLHLKFLLRFVLLDNLADPDDVIVEIAHQMLSLVVEGMLLRDYLVNSGHGLVWKVIQLCYSILLLY